ncbi:MAG: flagellin [Candidatus Didemnitutus sp.]|nr:flagellin [Candidatus Didemnitutus sp.]
MRIVFDGTTANAYIDGSPTPSMTTNPSPASGPIQLSSNAANGIRVRNLSVASTEGSGSEVSTVTSAADLQSLSLSSITAALSDVATFRANNGAQQSRLGFAAEVLAVNKANIEAANSRITDVDVAQESTQLARYNILVQSGAAMLSQANQSAQMALRLLG